MRSNKVIGLILLSAAVMVALSFATLDLNTTKKKGTPQTGGPILHGDSRGTGAYPSTF